MDREQPDVRAAPSSDGLGIVLVIVNPSSVPVTVFEPHPHTSVQLYDACGRPWPMHHGVFAADPRWHVTVPPAEVCQRIVTLPRFFLDAQGTFDVECAVRYQVGEQPGRLTVRGAVRLALPSAAEYYSEAGLPVRLRLERYERSGFVYPLPDDAEPNATAGGGRAE
jgi:hypothetical protein